MDQYTGSDFDEFLAGEGILEEVTARAHQRLLALQLQDAIEATELTKTELAERMQTAGHSSDRLLDPENTSIPWTRWSV